MMRTILLNTVCLLLISGSIFSQSHFITDSAYLKKVETQFQNRKEIAKNRADKLFNVFDNNLTIPETEALKFLYAYMPLSDLADYDGSLFLNYVRYAFKTKEEFSWGKTIPEDIFRHFVLPYRVNNENLDTARIVFFNELKDRIKKLTMRQAALEVNHWCHEKVTYKSTDGRTISPLGAVCSAFGRCGEESTFFVTALRSVGIPARQVYVPRWAHCDDNHAWVEVWIDGKWHYMGACEPEADLDIAWFTENARRAMLVHTKVFGDYSGKEEVLSKTSLFTQINTLANYAITKVITVKVVDKKGKPAVNAAVEFKLYNYAEFYTLVKQYTDNKGICKFRTGLGDLLVWAVKDSVFGYEKISVDKKNNIVIKLNKYPAMEYSVDYDFAPPIEKVPYKIDEKGREDNSERLKNEDKIRGAFEATFMDSASSVKLAQALQLNSDTVLYFIKKSKGNWKEISAFLTKASAINKNMAVSLLSRLSEKDYHDTRCVILLDHINFSKPKIGGIINDNKTMFEDYVLAPRIDNEALTDYKEYLQKQFTLFYILKAQKKIGVITDWIKNNIKIDEDANYYRVPITPKGVFDLKICDKHSRDILFVAMCRSFGIPARLEPATRVPQFFGDKWVDIYFEKEINPDPEKGFILLENVSENTSITPEYYVHYTLEKYEDKGYKTLDYEYNGGKGILGKKNEMETGNYLLVTGNRLNDGTVLAKLNFFNLKKDETKNIKIELRKSQSNPVIYGKVTLKASLKQEESAAELSVEKLLSEKGLILIWIDPDKEPTKHVFAELQSLKEKFDKLECKIVLIKSKDQKNIKLNKDIINNLPLQSLVLTDENKSLLTNIKKLTNSNSQSMPIIAVINNSAEVVYYSTGYKIGVGELIAKAILQLQSSCRR